MMYKNNSMVIVSNIQPAITRRAVNTIAGEKMSIKNGTSRTQTRLQELKIKNETNMNRYDQGNSTMQNKQDAERRPTLVTGKT